MAVPPHINRSSSSLLTPLPLAPFCSLRCALQAKFLFLFVALLLAAAAATDCITAVGDPMGCTALTCTTGATIPYVGCTAATCTGVDEDGVNTPYAECKEVTTTDVAGDGVGGAAASTEVVADVVGAAVKSGASAIMPSVGLVAMLVAAVYRLL